MKLLTKNTDYAVRALIYLAGQEGRFVSSREIANKQKIPLQYLRRILQLLIKAEFVAAKEGVGGGVTLNIIPGMIRVADVIRICQGKIQLSECLFRKRNCFQRGTCVLRKRLLQVERKVAGEFEQITIGNLISDQGGVGCEEKNNKD